MRIIEWFKKQGPKRETADLSCAFGRRRVVYPRGLALCNRMYKAPGDMWPWPKDQTSLEMQVFADIVEELKAENKRLREAMATVSKETVMPQAKEPGEQKNEKPDYRWLAMDEDSSVFTFSKRPEWKPAHPLLGPDIGLFLVDDDLIHMHEIFDPPHWLKPYQLWAQVSNWTENIPSLKQWDGNWWRLVEDHNTKDSYVPPGAPTATVKISDLAAKNEILQKDINDLTIAINKVFNRLTDEDKHYDIKSLVSDIYYLGRRLKETFSELTRISKENKMLHERLEEILESDPFTSRESE